MGEPKYKHFKRVESEQHSLRKIKAENHLFTLAIVIVLIAILVINTAYVLFKNSQSIDKYTSSSEIDSSHVLTSLQIGSSDSIRVRISNVTENDKIDPAFTIDSTNTMLIMNISITNLTSDIQHLFPASQFYIRTDQNVFSTLHPSMYITNPLQATDLKPKQTVAGQVSFSVSKESNRPLLYIDTNWDNSVPIVFDVLH